MCPCLRFSLSFSFVSGFLHFISTGIIEPWLNLNPVRTVGIMHGDMRFFFFLALVTTHCSTRSGSNSSIHTILWAHTSAHATHNAPTTIQIRWAFYLIFRHKLCLCPRPANAIYTESIECLRDGVCVANACTHFIQLLVTAQLIAQTHNTPTDKHHTRYKTDNVHIRHITWHRSMAASNANAVYVSVSVWLMQCE